MQGFDNTNIELITVEKTYDLVEKVVSRAAKAVTATMGPNGKYAVISTGTKTKVTKDGVTVARSLKFNDPRMELVNKVATEAPIKTDEECGDGTTTTMLLLGELFKLYYEFNTYREQEFIDKLVRMWITELENETIHIDVTDDRLYDLARTSANNDTRLSNLVVDLYRQDPNSTPSIELVLGVEAEDRIVTTDGLSVPAVFSNVLYAGNHRGGRKFNSYVPIVIDEYIRGNDPDLLLEMLSTISERVRKEVPANVEAIILVARSVETSMDNIIVAFNAALRRQYGDSCHQFAAMRMNGAGGSVGTMILEDFSIMLGCQLYSTVRQALTAELVLCNAPFTVNPARTVVVPDSKNQPAIDQRVEEIRESLKSYDARTRFTRRARFDENRVRTLTGKVITIWVGGETESDVIERRDRFEDVVKAVKSALINGIIPGVGTTLIKAMDQVAGNVVKETIQPGEPGFPKEWKAILGGVVEVAHKQNEILMDGVFPDGNPDKDVLDLATGRRGKAEELGIFDTAYAAITALKGGAQTAKILANMSSILLTNKLDAVALEG